MIEAKINFYRLLTVTILISGLMMLSSKLSVAQNSPVLSGRILDAESKFPLQFVTVTLMRNAKVIMATSSDKAGKFSFDKITPGSYGLKADLLGYISYGKQIEINLDNKSVYIGDVLINPDLRQLAEVKITAQNLITQSVDRITYKVENDPQRHSADVLTILPKVPLLSVDGVGKIKVMGEENFRVVINGKNSAILANNPSEYLRSLQASEIKSIEVITNPGGKYLTEGVTSVINIITKRKIGDGYELAGNTQYKTPAGGFAAGINQTLKVGSFGATVFTSYANTNRPFTTYELTRKTFVGTPVTLIQKGKQRNDTKSRIINADLTYELDSLQLLTTHIGVYSQPNETFTEFTADSNLPSADIYEVHNKADNKLKDAEFSIDYQKQYSSNKNKILTVSYLFTRSQNNLGNFITTARNVGLTGQSYEQSNRNIQEEHTTQLDFVSFLKKTKVNTGLKGVIRKGIGEFATAGEQLQQSEGFTNELFSNNQYLLFAYNSYQFSVKRWEFLIGYRFEFARYASNFSSSANAVYNNYLNVLPSIVLNYKLSNAEGLNLSFNQAVQRPNISYLNPFVNRLNPNLEVAGNPGIRPVLTNRLNFRYTKFSKSSLILSASYLSSNNEVQQIYSLTDSIDVLRLTYGNVASKKNLAFNISYSFPILKKLNVNFSGNTLFTKLQGVVNQSELSRAGIVCDLNLGINYSVNQTTLINVRAAYTSPSIYLQGNVNNYPAILIGASKSFLNKRMTISGNIANPFTKFQRIKADFDSFEFEQRQITQIYARSFLIKASFSYGEIKTRTRERTKTISNDDMLKK